MTLNAIKKRRSSNKQAGSVLVEAAIMLPVLILFFLGAVDFARLLFTAVQLGNAVTAGAEYGSRSLTAAQNTSVINSTVTGDASKLTGVVAASSTYCTCPGSSTPVGCTTICSGYGTPKMYVSVTGSYTWSSFVRWPQVPNTVALTRTVVMRAR